MSELSSALPLFDDGFQRALPGDTQQENRTRQVLSACYSSVACRQPSAPQRVATSEALAVDLNLPDDFVRSQLFTEVFSGKTLLSGMKPYAMCYGGHQFGHWAGQLGDGRAINLGERADETGRLWQYQLKGAGPTPYSRHADGLAVLRSSVREFLCSEAMHYLGVPTTRALSLCLTGDKVERDMFYNGNPQFEPGAVVCRVAPSFLRFGNYELFASRQDHSTLRQLMAYTLRQLFPDLYPLWQKNEAEAILQWFQRVVLLTSELMVQWSRVGFVHGVMNTDNMSILGLTIDYGPYGWLDNYDPQWTPNTTDAQQGRYRFGQQANIAQWNLLQLANAIYPLVGSAPELESLIVDYERIYDDAWLKMMGQKCGLPQLTEAQRPWLHELLQLLYSAQCDMTLFYRALADLSLQDILSEADVQAFLMPLTYQVPSEEQVLQFHTWLSQYRHFVNAEGIHDVERKAQMDCVNPAFILRNYLSQQAIDLAHQGDYSEVKNLQELLARPYEIFADAKYYEKRPEWAKNKAGCSMLSCSS